MQPDSGKWRSAWSQGAGYLHQDPRLNPDETLWGEAERAPSLRLHELHQKLDHVYRRDGDRGGDKLRSCWRNRPA